MTFEVECEHLYFPDKAIAAEAPLPFFFPSFLSPPMPFQPPLPTFCTTQPLHNQTNLGKRPAPDSLLKTKLHSPKRRATKPSLVDVVRNQHLKAAVVASPPQLKQPSKFQRRLQKLTLGAVPPKFEAGAAARQAWAEAIVAHVRHARSGDRSQGVQFVRMGDEQLAKPRRDVRSWEEMLMWSQLEWQEQILAGKVF